MTGRRGGLAAVCLALVMTACGGGGSSPPPPIDEAYPEAQLQLGAEVYDGTCSVCHGRNGEGGIGPSVALVADRLTIDEVRTQVHDGKGAMPAFSGTLTDEEIDAVVAFVRVGLRS